MTAIFKKLKELIDEKDYDQAIQFLQLCQNKINEKITISNINNNNNNFMNYDFNKAKEILILEKEIPFDKFKKFIEIFNYNVDGEDIIFYLITKYHNKEIGYKVKDIEKKIKYLVDEKNIDINKNYENFPALYYAILTNNWELINIIISNGANLLIKIDDDIYFYYDFIKHMNEYYDEKEFDDPTKIKINDDIVEKLKICKDFLIERNEVDTFVNLFG